MDNLEISKPFRLREEDYKAIKEASRIQGIDFSKFARNACLKRLEQIAVNGERYFLVVHERGVSPAITVDNHYPNYKELIDALQCAIINIIEVNKKDFNNFKKED